MVPISNALGIKAISWQINYENNCYKILTSIIFWAWNIYIIVKEVFL